MVVGGVAYVQRKDMIPAARPKAKYAANLSGLWTAVSLALAALPAASPFWGAGLPRTNDAFAHLYRTLALDQLVREGSLWPRWSADLVHGYGYPVFNFFPSLSHLVVELFHLAGLPLTTAYRAAGTSHFILTAWGAYALGKALFGRAAGWVVALAYVYSPYFLYDAHVRGSLPETQALALLPLFLFTIHYSVLSQPFSRFTLHVSRHSSFILHPSPFILPFVFALLFLSHPIAYQLLIPIGFWLLILAWRNRYLFTAETQRTRSFFLNLLSDLRASAVNLIGPVVGLALGGLLTAFFWLPAFAEVGFTRSELSISQGYAFQDNFLSLGQMVAWPRLPADPALVNPPVVRALPVAALVMAAALLPLRWRGLDRRLREEVLTWTILLALSIFLITPLSRPVWETVPLLRLTFFPWRLLSMASLAAALLLGAAVSYPHPPSLEERGEGLFPLPQRERVRVRVDSGQRKESASIRAHPRPTLFLLITLLITAAIPWLYPPRESIPESPTLADLSQFEQPPYLIGTTNLAEFLPLWVEELPDTQALKQALAATGAAERLEAADGLTFQHLSGPVWDATYAIQASRPLTLTYRQFYFPGWQATLDDAPLRLTPSRPHGLITTSVPAGDHTLHLAFGSTWARTLGWAISGLGLLLVLSFQFSVFRRQVAGGKEQVASDLHPSAFSLHPSSFVFFGLWVVALWLFFSRVDTPLRRPTLQPDSVLGRPIITPLDYAGEIRLLSYEQSAVAIAADEPVQLTLYWRPLRPIGVAYDVGVQIVDERGLVWSAGGGHRPPDWRFIAGRDPWPLDSYRMDPFILELLDGAPPGAYTFHVGLVRRDTGQTVDAHQVGQVMVTRPARGEPPLEEGMTPAAPDAVAAGLRLLGSRLDRREAVPGEPVRVTTLWQAQDPAAALPPAGIVVQLVAADGQLLLAEPITLAPGYPPTQWRPGDRLRSEIVLRLPAHVPAGQHEWQVFIPGLAAWPIGSLTVHKLPRQWQTPPLDVQVNTPLGDVATLLGAIYNPAGLAAGQPFPVTLVWRAEVETSVSYRVFLHLLDAQGQIVAQADGEPANWQRPTTGWLPGEIILDERLLALPADQPTGPYTLVAGMYELESGRRLLTPTRADQVILSGVLPSR